MGSSTGVGAAGAGAAGPPIGDGGAVSALVPAEEDAVFEIVTTVTKFTKFTLTPCAAAAIFAQAVLAAKAAGLPWRDDPLVLTPKPAFLQLVQKSHELLDVGEDA